MIAVLSKARHHQRPLPRDRARSLSAALVSETMARHNGIIDDAEGTRALARSFVRERSGRRGRGRAYAYYQISACMSLAPKLLELDGGGFNSPQVAVEAALFVVLTASQGSAVWVDYKGWLLACGKIVGPTSLFSGMRKHEAWARQLEAEGQQLARQANDKADFWVSTCLSHMASA